MALKFNGITDCHYNLYNNWNHSERDNSNEMIDTLGCKNAIQNLFTKAQRKCYGYFISISYDYTLSIGVILTWSPANWLPKPAYHFYIALIWTYMPTIAKTY